MPQSPTRVILHTIYSTKHLAPLLRNATIRSDLFAYNATILRDQVDSPAICINGTDDHVQILCQLSRKRATMDVINASKTETSKWLKKQQPHLKQFQWQAGYGVFSVSESNVETVREYIANQEHHHRKMTVQEEFREICRRHGLPIDERYVWV